MPDYILRAFLLWDIDWFLQHFVTIRYHSCEAVSSHNWYRHWLDHMYRIASSEEFGKAIQSCMAMFTKETMKDEIRFTMRMTCVESY